MKTMDSPTAEEVKEKLYGHFANRTKYKPGRCAQEVHDPEARSFSSWQCHRKSGYGPDGLYCKQHARQFGALPGDEETTVFVVKNGAVIRVSGTRVGNSGAVRVIEQRRAFGNEHIYDSILRPADYFDSLPEALTACERWHAAQSESLRSQAAEHSEACRKLALLLGKKG